MKIEEEEDKERIRAETEEVYRVKGERIPKEKLTKEKRKHLNLKYFPYYC